MTELLSEIEAPSDAELISRVRGGDTAAYGDLFSRHVDAANRLARQLVRGPDMDDLVSEAFAKVLHVLQGGGGPDVAFRAYLLTSIRRLHVDRIRAGSKLQTSDDMSQFDPGVPFQDTAVASFESGAAAKAFASLPERWQLVLWHLEVEEQKPADIAPLLGMSANSVSALAYRAREGLRQAFLTMHLADISVDECRWVNEHLGAYVRKGLSRRDTTKVEEHLDECRRCTAMYLELSEVNSNLSGIIAPLLLGAAASGYLASTGAAGATGVLALLGRVRDTIGANAGAATATAVAAGVAAVATAGFLIATAGDDDVTAGANGPLAATSSAAPDAVVPPEPRTDRPDPKADKTPEASPAASPDAVPPVDDATPPTATLPGVALPSAGATPEPSTDPATEPASDPTTGPTSDPTTGPTDGPTDGPTTPPRPPADLRLGAVTVEPGGILSVTVEGIPSDLASFGIDLGSQQTTFGPAGSQHCVVSRPRHAECMPTLSGMGAGMAVARMAAPETFTALLPLEFPAGMTSDGLTITVTTTTHDEANPDDNTSAQPISFNPIDLGLGSLTATEHTVARNGTDTFDLATDLTGVPADLQELIYTLDSDGDAAFGDPGIAGCTRDNATQVTCDNPTDNTLDVTVVLSDDNPQDVTLGLAVPSRYDDTDTGNDTTGPFSLTPTPETDVGLGALTATDHQTTPNGTDIFDVTSPLTVSTSLPAATFTLDGNATFGTPDTAGCTRDDTKNVTCVDPSSGSLDLTVRLTADSDTDINITGAVPSGYVDTSPGNDTTDPALTLTPTPEADLGLGDLEQTSHTVNRNGTDTYHLDSLLTGVPSERPDLTFALGGNATFGAPGTAGCTRTSNDTELICTDPVNNADLDFVVLLTDDSGQEVTITVQAPSGYVDTNVVNNKTAAFTLTPTPEVDLGLGPLTVTEHTTDDEGTDTFNVTSPLTVSGDLPAATFTLSGNATFGTPDTIGCARDHGTQVTCTDPNNGPLNLTVLLSADSDTDVSITGAVPSGYVDTSPGNDTTAPALTLTPTPEIDVIMDSLTVAGHNGSTSRVRAVVSGVPDSATRVDFTLSDHRDNAWFTGGANGGSGQGDVSCAVKSETLMTCTRPRKAFWADVDVRLPGSSSERVTITAEAFPNDENGPTRNNWREVTIPRSSTP